MEIPSTGTPSTGLSHVSNNTASRPSNSAGGVQDGELMSKLLNYPDQGMEALGTKRRRYVYSHFCLFYLLKFLEVFLTQELHSKSEVARLICPVILQ